MTKPYSQKHRYSNAAVVPSDDDPTVKKPVPGSSNYVVTARAANSAMGYVEIYTDGVVVVQGNPERSPMGGSRSYPFGTKLILSAKAREGYRFTRWSDGGTKATRTVTVTANADYVAYFELVPVVKPEEPEQPIIDDPNPGGSGGSSGGGGVLEPTVTETQQTGILQLLKKWWWAIAILALMFFDTKGGE